VNTVQDYHGSPGENIQKSARECILLSAARGCTVRLNFNEIQLLIDGSMSVEKVLEAYDQAWADRSARYWASQEGQQALQELEDIKASHQSRHDKLMAVLWDVAGDESKLMDWLYDFSDAADHVGVEGKDFQRVSSVLELHGYVENDCVGWDKCQFENPRVMARYIAGQALNCMKRMNMGPHPMTQTFVEKYHALTKLIDSRAIPAILRPEARKLRDD
jgi:hypothetical protein